MNPLHFVLSSDPQAQSFSLSVQGTLDDTADFGSVLAAFQKTPPKEIHFDLEGVARTNSVGIRTWLLFLDRLPPRCALIFEKVSHSFIEQANMVPNLLGAPPVQLRSFQIPEVCPSCDQTSVRTLRIDQVQAQSDGHWHYPPAKCGKCGAALELDALELEFFQFYKRDVKKA